MYIIPITLSQANYMVSHFHRHHKPVTFHRFSIGVVKDNHLVGAAIVGKPVSRGSDQLYTAEVTRLVTDGTTNACSMLYAACARITKEMGFHSIQTYILETELGTSLKASGWKMDGMTRGGNWNTKARKGRREDQPMGPKMRWSKELNPLPSFKFEISDNNKKAMQLIEW